MASPKLANRAVERQESPSATFTHHAPSEERHTVARDFLACSTQRLKY